MRFVGLDPWPEAVPLIEVQSKGSTFDLHNWGEFAGFSFETPDSHRQLAVAGPRWGLGAVEFRFGDLVLEFRAEAVEIDGELPWETSD